MCYVGYCYQYADGVSAIFKKPFKWYQAFYGKKYSAFTQYGLLLSVRAKRRREYERAIMMYRAVRPTRQYGRAL